MIYNKADIPDDLQRYFVRAELGLEKLHDCLGWATGDPCGECHVCHMVDVFRLVRDVLADDGTLWINYGDSYFGSGRGGNPTAESSTLEGSKEHQEASMVKRGSQLPAGLHENARQAGNIGRAWVKPPTGLKQKDLCMVPARIALALQADGWYLRQDIIWHKPNPMPESVRDRCTKSHEYLFLLAKSERYYFDNGSTSGAVAGSIPWEGLTRNKRSVWTVGTVPYSGAHFATFPPALIEPCILAGSRPGDIVLDPFFGSGTTGQVAESLGRKWLGIEINPKYESLQKQRTAQRGMVL